MNIKEMVAKDGRVSFVHYKLGELWYRVGDCGDGTFLAEDKAILFMRYLRRHLASLVEARRSHDAAMSDR